jgi:hypothetical protein
LGQIWGSKTGPIPQGKDLAQKSLYFPEIGPLFGPKVEVIFGPFLDPFWDPNDLDPPKSLLVLLGPFGDPVLGLFLGPFWTSFGQLCDPFWILDTAISKVLLPKGPPKGSHFGQPVWLAERYTNIPPRWPKRSAS